MDGLKLFIQGGCLLIVLLAAGCRGTDTGSLPVRYAEPVPDSCRTEPDHHYFVSEPEIIPAGQKLPLVLLIDPHGDGKLAVENFSRALTDIPAVLAGSEIIRNNYKNFESSLSHLEADVLARYPADPQRVIMAGFSGGARMAFYYGMSHKTAGIIMYGAGPGRSAGKTGGTRVYMVSGTRDFNFLEQYRPPFPALNDAHDYMTDFFRGKHEWPPSENIYESVTWVLMDEPGFPRNIPYRISEKMLAEYHRLLDSNELFLAGKALEKARIFSADDRRRTRISRTIDDFEKSSAWINYKREFEGYLQKELRLRQAYVDQLTEPDTNWWKKEIISLNQNIMSCSDPVREDFLYRLKGFIGIILYSRISALLQNDPHSAALEPLLLIYGQAEPESPDLVEFKQQVQHLSVNEAPDP